jgi:hypothetical protein
MYKRNVIAVVACAFAASGSAEDSPQVSLSVPPKFATEVSVKHYRKGQDLLHDQNYHLIAVAPLTQYHGWFGPRVADQADIHGWDVDVFARYSPKVAAACAAAKDGYEADLNIEPEFFGVDERSYMFARFQHKRFSLGTAVSFLSQATQDSPPHYYVPHNGHLQYEVWGVTPDKRFTVVASVSVSHPKLADWGDERLRDTRTIVALKRDKDYKLVERCSPDQFEPSLTAFNRMLDTLVIR